MAEQDASSPEPEDEQAAEAFAAAQTARGEPAVPSPARSLEEPGATDSQAAEAAAAAEAARGTPAPASPAKQTRSKHKPGSHRSFGKE